MGTKKLENLERNMSARLRIRQSMVVRREVEPTVTCHRIELMVGELRKQTARGAAGAEKAISRRIIHPVTQHHRF